MTIIISFTRKEYSHVPNDIHEERIQKLFRTDRLVIFLSIILMLGILGFVLITILPQSPPGTTRIVMVIAALAVASLATFSLVRVLTHLSNHKNVLYSEDIRELDSSDTA